MVLGRAKSVLGTPQWVLGASKLLGRFELLPGQVSADHTLSRSSIKTLLRVDILDHSRGQYKVEATNSVIRIV
jgi:hypothetical protein